MSPPTGREETTEIETITRETFRLLVTRFGPGLRAYCRRILGGRREAADEVLQETFRVAWTRRLEFQGGNPGGWLYAIARRQALYRLRTEIRYRPLLPESLCRATMLEHSGGPSRTGPDPLEIEHLYACFAGLEQSDATIVQLAYGLHGEDHSEEHTVRMTYAEIGQVVADRHGQPFAPDRVRMRLKRALARLERCMHRKALAVDSSSGRHTSGQTNGTRPS